MHVKEVMKRVYALRLGTTVVIRVTLNPSSSPLFFSSLSDSTCTNGVWTRPEGQDRNRGGGNKKCERVMREWGSLELELLRVLTLELGFILGA